MGAKPQLSTIDGRGARASDGYVLENQVGHLLRRAHQRATSIFTELMAAHQLTPTQFAALAKILDEKSVSQNELGRLTAMDPATMQGVMGRLCDRGLVARNADPSDRRRMTLTLTPAGRRLAETAREVGRQVTEETLSPLSENERVRFLSLLRKLC